MERVLRASIAPLIFIAVGTLSWFLVSQWRAENESQACVAGGPTMPRATLAVPSEEPPASGTEALIRAVSGSAEHPRSVVSLSTMQSTPPARELNQDFGMQGTRNADADAGSADELVQLLDGGMGSRPPSAMINCTFAGGFSCGSCTHDSDCPAGQGCGINRSTGRFECMASECEDDHGCFPGTSCRAVAGNAPGPIIRRCVPSGQRAEGERCALGFVSGDQACQEGLLCVNSVCGKPCTLGMPDACPRGHRCDEGVDGNACVPDCQTLGCSNGEKCVEYKGAFECIALVMDECANDASCPTGQHCVTDRRDGRGGRFCAAPCKSWLGNASCPDGFVCGRGGPKGSSCYRECDPQDLNTCPQGWLCKTVSEDLQTWGCRPDIAF